MDTPTPNNVTNLFSSATGEAAKAAKPSLSPQQQADLLDRARASVAAPNLTTHRIYEYSAINANFPPGVDPNAVDLAVLQNQLSLSDNWETWRVERAAKNTVGLIGTERHKKGTFVLHLRRPITYTINQETGDMHFPVQPSECMMKAIEQLRLQTKANEEAKERN